MRPVTVIAEAGVNHNGHLDLAMELVDAAAEAGADVVKFQSFRAGEVATEHAPKARYQSRNLGEGGSQLAMLERLELSEAAQGQLQRHCAARGIGFLSTAFDLPSLTFLTEELGLVNLKIPSGELTNAPFVLEHARRAETLVVSTGMATLDEVRLALSVIAFGLTRPEHEQPTADAFATAMASQAGAEALNQRVTLLHCTSDYPAQLADVNLTAMTTMGREFGVHYGYSDHTDGIAVATAAVALGAVVVEKHLTLDRGLPGPDHQASLEPADLHDMVQAIRDVAAALGDGVKRPRGGEIHTRDVARKSVVAIAPIGYGEPFGTHNVGVKRPGTGLSPDRWWALQGDLAGRSYAPGDLIEEER